MAAFFPLVDICFQRKHFRGKTVKRNVLVPPPKADAPPAKPKEEGKAPPKGKEAAKPKPAKGGKK